MKKISVIVPIYNTEKYLRTCLESLINQTLKDIEIILVNDGSKDNSQKIIDEYTQKHPKIIKSFSQSNSGQGAARQLGIKNAIGDYISFIDSDDYIDTTALEQMYNKAISNDFDIVVCDFEYVYDNPKLNKNISSSYTKDLTKENEIKKSMITHYPSVCNKIFKTKILTKTVEFKSNVFFEDVEFLYRLYPHINSIGVINKPLYKYLQREGSTTHTFNQKLFDYIDNWNDIIKYYKNNSIYDEYKEILEYCYVRYLYATFIKQTCNFNKKDYQIAVDLAIKNVKHQFPRYRKNKYFYTNVKGIYLLLFGKITSKIVYKIYNK